MIQNEPTITCPHCSGEVKLTESLAGPLLKQTREKYEQQLRAQGNDIQRRETELAQRENLVAETVARKVAEQTARIAEELKAAARREASLELDAARNKLLDVESTLRANNEKLAQAQSAQAEFERKSRLLDDEKRELQLTVERQVAGRVDSERAAIRLQIESEAGAKLAEKEQQMQSMARTIEDLKRKAEQGSQQAQGEALEVQIEAALLTTFKYDRIEPVPKGEYGGDILQYVCLTSGQQCGSILWESKQTKTWSDAWLVKLRDDQRAAKADLCVIVSQTLPKEINGFGQIDGVWIVSPQFYIPLACALHSMLLDMHRTRASIEGRETKMEMMYTYLTGPRFRQRVQAIAESFSIMRDDLDKERKAITKQWAKREEQINRAMESTASMFGEMQGIAGSTLQEIEGLSLKQLE